MSAICSDDASDKFLDSMFMSPVLGSSENQQKQNPEMSSDFKAVENEIFKFMN